jgi:hypothetical protein
MEEAVAELAALTAGSPAEAVLQQETMKAAAATADALKSLQTLDTTATASASLASTDLVTVGSSSSSRVQHAGGLITGDSGGGGSGSSSSGGSSSGGSSGLGIPAGWGLGSRDAAVKSPTSALNSMSEGEAVAAAAAVDSALAEYEHQVLGGSNGSSTDLHGSNGSSRSSSRSSSHKYGDFASEYSIWDEESIKVQDGTPAADAAAAAAAVAASAADGSSVGAAAGAAGAAGAAAALGAVAAAEQPVQQGTATGKASDTKQHKKQKKRKDTAAAAEPKPWWAVLIPYIPSSSGRDSSNGTDGKSVSVGSVDDGSSSSSHEPQHPGEPPTTLATAEPLSQSQGHWWQPLIDNDFIRSLPGVAKKDQGAKQQQDQPGDATSSAAAEGGKEADAGASNAQTADQQQGEKKQPWWSFVTDLSWVPGLGGSSDDDDGRESGAAAAADGASKPVEAIVIPADLPIEEIAREVAKLKEDAWRSKEDHLESLWARTVERNDRSWVMLLCFLLSVAIGLLAVVAYRISGLGDSGTDPADAAAAAAAAGAATAAAAGAAPDAAQEVGKAAAAGDATAAVAAVAAAAAGAAPDAAAAAAGSGGDGGQGATNLVMQLPVMTLAVLSWWLANWGGGGL